METRDVEMQHVLDRLGRVENQNRWLVRGGLALVLSCVTVLLMAQKPVARTIEAQAFVLKDAAGEVRAELHMSGSGPELRLYDSQHNTSAVLAADEKSGPLLGLWTQEGTAAGLGLDKNGPALSLRMGQAKAFLSVGQGGPELVLNGSGKAEADLAVYKDVPFLSLGGSDGSADVRVANDGPDLSLRKGKAEANLAAEQDGPHMRLESSEDSMRATVDKDGPYLGLHSSGGGALLEATKDGPKVFLLDLAGFNTVIGTQGLVAPNTGEKTQTSAASIHLFDPKGKTLWSAP